MGLPSTTSRLDRNIAKRMKESCQFCQNSGDFGKIPCPVRWAAPRMHTNRPLPSCTIEILSKVDNLVDR